MNYSSCTRTLIGVSLAILIGIPGAASAHQPARPEVQELRIGDDFVVAKSSKIADPTVASQAIYGELSEPDEVDLYSFTASKDQVIPVEVLVPVRPSLKEFKPWVAMWGTELAPPAVPQTVLSTIAPLTLPPQYRVSVVSGDTGNAPRKKFFEPFSVENLYHGNEVQIHVHAGRTYFIAVYDPSHRTGAYSLGIGSAEDFTGTSFPELLWTVLKIKLGVHAGVEVPWADILGVFLMMAGFIIGLGAVTVIDIHGFLGRRSRYWTEATTRTHKVTKPLIWIGLALALAGGTIMYRDIGFSGTAPIHAVLALLLVANGIFLTFRVSPYMLQREREGHQADLLPASWQRKIAVSLVCSVIGWWGSLFLFAWHLIMLR